MSLLTICQDAADAIGIQRPASIIGNTDDDARTLLAFAKEELDSLKRGFNWPQLIREGYIDLDPDFQFFDIKVNSVVVDDVDRFVPDTAWDRGARRRANFPASSKEWARWLGEDVLVSSLNRRMRRAWGATDGNLVPHLAIEVLDLSAGDLGEKVYIEYISSKPVQIDSSTDQRETWEADNDTCLLSEYVVRLGVIWRYKASKALPYAKDEQKYRLELEKAKSSVKGSSAVNMAPPRYPDAPPFPLPPDHGYG